MCTNMKERNISVDFLRFLAALLITNSHMQLLYGKYAMLATGGSIGDALFFFCSGFTLFLKPMGTASNFPDWYKRRINRIYPSVLAIAIVACGIFNIRRDIIDIILYGGGWFITYIMVYYVLIFFIGAYLKDKTIHFLLLSAVLTGLYFFIFSSKIYTVYYYNIYSDAIIRWPMFMMPILLGAQIGVSAPKIKYRPWVDTIGLIVSVAAFYILIYLSAINKQLMPLQYVSCLVLMVITYFFYQVGCSPLVKRIYQHRTGHFIIRFVGGLCLEIYLVQRLVFTDKMNSLFPLNLLIMFVIVIAAAYLVRCLARIISQTFKDEPYQWKKVFSAF